MARSDAAVKPLVDIAPSRGWRPIDLREMWEYRDLLAILVWRDVKIRYRQTFLGILWVVAQPLMTMLIFTLLFNRVGRIQPDSHVPYSLYVMAALVPWTFFSTGATSSGNSLIGNAHLISKVYFPRMIVPAAAVISGGIDMLVTLVLVVIMTVLYGVPLSWMVLLVPAGVVLCAAFALGVGLWLSALNVEYRDVRVVVPFLMQIWLFATPVVYPLSALPAKARLVARANPMTAVVELFRSAFVPHPVDWSNVAWAAVAIAIVLATGAFYFRRSERRFADVL